MRGLNRFYRQIMMMFSGTVVAQLIVVMSTPVLTRIYTPADFGIYQLFVSFTSLTSMVATCKYELGIIAPKHDYEAFVLAVVTCIISVIFSLVFGVVCYIGADYIAFFKEMYFSGFSFWIGAYTLLICIYQICYMLFVRMACYKYTVTAGLVYSFFCVFFPVVAYYVSIKDGLIIGTVLAKLVAIVYFFYKLQENGYDYRKIMNCKYYKRVLIKYADFVRYALPGNVLNTMATNAPAFILNSFYGMTVTGYYSMANRCVGLPVALASKSAGDVFKREASKEYQLTKQCYTIFRRVMMLLVKLSLVYSLIVVLFAPTIFGAVLGENWVAAGEYARLLVLAGATGLIYSPLSSIFDLAVREKEYMVLQCLSLCLVLCVLTIGGKFCSANITLIAYAVGISFVNSIGLICCRRIAKGE